MSSNLVLGIAESINIMGTRSGTAMKAREKGPIQEMAQEETAAGAAWLDLNVGPARKDGTELLPWVVQTIEEVTTLPLCLDTTNTAAMAAGFGAIKNKKGAIMNSISAQPERMEKLIPVAAEAGCNVITLLWGPDGMPRDSNERCAMSVDLMMALNEAGIPNEKMIFDPIATPITLGADQLASGLEFLSMLQEIAPGRPFHRRSLQRLQRRGPRVARLSRPHLPDHADEVQPDHRHRQLLRPGADGDLPGRAPGHRHHGPRDDRRQRSRSCHPGSEGPGALQDL